MRSRAVLHSGEVCSRVTAILGVSVLLLLGGTAVFVQAPASAPPVQRAMMDAVGGMATMRGPSSATPGQAGASHLYHIGSNGFFFNHARHITLTQDQKLTLNQLKEKAMLDRASEQRRIDQAEKEWYTLTVADQPDDARMQAKIVEIETLRADQRLNFIRAVAEANNVLTPEQRQVLLGTMAAPPK